MPVVGCTRGISVQDCEALAGADDEGAIPMSVNELSTATIENSCARLSVEKVAGVGGRCGQRGQKDSDTEEVTRIMGR